MRNEIKLGLYVVLVIGTILFGVLALSSYRHLMHQPSETPLSPVSPMCPH